MKISPLFAQQIPESVKNYIEDYYSIRSDVPEEVNVNMIFDQLSYFLEHPLSINEASRNELQDLHLLTTLQIDALLLYRKNFGPLMDIYELQAVPQFDLPTIRRLLPFVWLGQKPGWAQNSLGSTLRQSQGVFYLRIQRQLEKTRGFVTEDGLEPAFEGSPEQIFTRLQYRKAKNYSLGFTAEKDAGEAFLRKSNPQGFDYYTAHLFVERPIKGLNNIVFGDYNLSLGQGLILHSGFGGGKSAFTTNIKKGGKAIRPHSSVAETTFMRGAAADIQLHPEWKALIFYSRKNIDGNLSFVHDSIAGQERQTFFTSLQNSGFHRTAHEIEDEKKVKDQIIGGRLSMEKEQFEIHVNYFSEKFSVPLNRRDDLYNLFVPESDLYQLLSLDYTYFGKSWHFFGETAYNGYGFSSLHGLLLSPVRNLQVSILQRYFEAQYYSLHANAFGEARQASNERGIYLGLDWHLAGPLHLSAYADVWKHPWLRFNVDAPSQGNEYLLRLRYYKKRRFEAYLQFRRKERWANVTPTETPTASILPRDRMQVRLHISQQLNKDIELRYRAEWIRSSSYTDEFSEGYLLYTDVLYKPIGFPLSFTSRFAIYDSPSYNARIYAYENNLLNAFSVPAYFGKGTRAYINLRWKVFRNLIWEFRFARSWKYRATEIGSGWNQIKGNKRSEIATQLKLTF